MCTRRLFSLAVVAACSVTLVACSSPERTGSAFCAQLGKELPAIAQPMLTGDDVSAMVDRYKRLLERSPLTIESDVKVLTDLLKQAANVDPTDATEVQNLADSSYRANQSSQNVRDWVMSTCAVDISTGMNITPMRQPTTTLAATTTVATTTAPTVPATPAPVVTTVAPVATTVP
ncbi:MAG: hypothetical protein RLZ18_1353 [Actinomycetota bacterium]|jgi:DNA-binding NarL/FixJ family response regulator